MNEGRRDPAAPPETGISVPPPYVILLAVLVSFLPYLAWPYGLGLPWYVRFPLAIALAAPFFLIFPLIFREFEKLGVDYDVRKMPARLVTGGPFRFSRNPGYLLFVMIFLAIAVAVDNLWSFPLIAIAFIFVRHVVIQEERVLENRFGQDYLAYKRRVRRWI